MFEQTATATRVRRKRAAKSPARKRISRETERIARVRAVGYDLEIPPPADPARRAAMLADPYEFMRLCFPDIFYQPFTPSRRDLVEALRYAGTTGGKQAWADARAGGKTRCALFMALWLELTGAQDFVLIVSKSGARAARELRNVKIALRDSPVFAADFPEVGVPIQRLRGQTKCQTAWGHPTDMEWTGADIVLPTIPTELLRAHGWPDDLQSVARGQIWSSLGILGPLRGYVVRNRRPGLAIVDDIDDRASARSEIQTENRIGIIEEDIAGLGGSDARCSVVYLCTIPNRLSAAYHFTDPQLSPAWNPRRTKLILRFPDRLDLWARYVELRRGKKPDDPDAREAATYYLSQREVMDAGHETSNPYHYDAKPLRDGQPAQVSALQSYYDWVADNGEVSALTELQNDPPAGDDGSTVILIPHRVQQCTTGLPRGVVPSDSVSLTIGADVGKQGCHWAAVAWSKDAAGSVIDYGFFRFVGTAGQPAGACELLILDGLHQWWDSLAAGWAEADGTPWDPDIALIDSGWKADGWNQQPVEQFTLAVGGRVVYPLKGFSPWHAKKPVDRKLSVGNNYAIDWTQRRPLVEINADHWKLRVHEGFIARGGDPGSLALWSIPPDGPGRDTYEEKQRRRDFAYQVCAERWCPNMSRGDAATRWGWNWSTGKAAPNHYLDAMAYALAAREVRGLSVMPAPAKPAPKPKPPPRKTEHDERPYLACNR